MYFIYILHYIFLGLFKLLFIAVRFGSVLQRVRGISPVQRSYLVQVSDVCHRLVLSRVHSFKE